MRGGGICSSSHNSHFTNHNSSSCPAKSPPFSFPFHRKWEFFTAFAQAQPQLLLSALSTSGKVRCIDRVRCSKAQQASAARIGTEQGAQHQPETFEAPPRAGSTLVSELTERSSGFSERALRPTRRVRDGHGHLTCTRRSVWLAQTALLRNHASRLALTIPIQIASYAA